MQKHLRTLTKPIGPRLLIPSVKTCHGNSLKSNPNTVKLTHKDTEITSRLCIVIALLETNKPLSYKVRRSVSKDEEEVIIQQTQKPDLISPLLLRDSYISHQHELNGPTSSSEAYQRI